MAIACFYCGEDAYNGPNGRPLATEPGKATCAKCWSSEWMSRGRAFRDVTRDGHLMVSGEPYIENEDGAHVPLVDFALFSFDRRVDPAPDGWLTLRSIAAGQSDESLSALCVGCFDDYAEKGSKLCRMCQFEHDRQVTR